MDPRPLTKEEADKCISNSLKSIEKFGLWNKICLNCGRSVGGRLAEYGKPTPVELSRCACPGCSSVGARTELIEYDKEESDE